MNNREVFGYLLGFAVGGAVSNTARLVRLARQRLADEGAGFAPSPVTAGAGRRELPGCPPGSPLPGRAAGGRTGGTDDR